MVSAAWGKPASETIASPAAAAPAWRAFLRGLALELDAQAGPAACAAVLRGTGQQMARLLTLPPVASMEALEIEMNAVLAELGWGSVRVALHETERCVVLTHTGLPRIGSAGEPPGTWLAPVLEGLYETWMGQQPGADASLRTRMEARGDTVMVRYGRF